jgi:hypothetical protein
LDAADLWITATGLVTAAALEVVKGVTGPEAFIGS